MSLKTVGLSISIGAIFTGATVLSATKTAITKLETSIKKIEDKKTTLKIDSKEYELATKKVTLLNNTIDKLKVNRAKMFQYIRCFGSIKSIIKGSLSFFCFNTLDVLVQS